MSETQNKTTTRDAEPDTPPFRVPVARDLYDHVTEYVECADAEAAKHWDERRWERVR